MLIPSYDVIQRFKSKISKINNTKELKQVLKQSNCTISTLFESTLPWHARWEILEESMVGNCNISVSPSFYAGGELYVPIHKEIISLPPNFSGFHDLDAQVLEALKRSVKNVQRVWNC